MRPRPLLRLAGFAAPLLLAAAPAQAQQQDGQLWLQTNGVAPLGPRLRLTLEQIERFSDRQGGLYQTELGGILGYRVSPQVEIGFGYRRVGAHNRSTGADEDRIRQHVVVTLGRFVGRLRVDERFNPGGREIGFRIRPLLRYNQPIGGTLALFLSHESFYLPNDTRWGQRRGYDRMRNIVGVALPLGKRANADIGYLNQYRPARGTSRAEMEHALSIQLTITVGSGPSAPHVED